MIQEKGREMFEKLKKQTPHSSHEEIEFKATTASFAKFTRRSSIKHVVMHGESDSADKEEAEKFGLRFQEFIKKAGSCPQQIFNYDETGLFWNRMPKRTYITKDEKNIPGHKPTKRPIDVNFGS